MWSLRLLWTWWKRINYLNSLLSTGKRTILTSSRTVLNAMIAMHVHRQLWLIILLLGIREKVNTWEFFSLLWKVWKRSIILTVSFQLENVPSNIQSFFPFCNKSFLHILYNTVIFLPFLSRTFPRVLKAMTRSSQRTSTEERETDNYDSPFTKHKFSNRS